MSKSFSDIEAELRHLVKCHIEKKKKSLEDTQFPHTYMTEPRSQATYLLDPKTIYTYLDIASEIQLPLLNAQTFYLHDLSDYQQTPYNSLIFDIDGRCFKSRDTTSQIIRRFARYNEKPYEIIQAIGQLIGVTQKCPYVTGDLFFAPDRGTSKNEANWLGLHHVIDTDSYDENSYFLFKNNHGLTLPLNKKTVNSIVERTYLLYRLEQMLIYNALKNHDRHHLVTLNQNIVKKMSHKIKLQTKMPSNEEIFLHLSFIKAIEIAANIMGVSHLTTEEIQEFYPEWQQIK